jgi:protein phosphatase
MSESPTIKGGVSFLSPGQRPIQEDFVLSNQEKGIFVVADGFGGAQYGVTAAKTACNEIQRFLFKEAGDHEATLPYVLRSYFSLAGNVLFNALIHANRKVLALNKDKSVYEKGGTSAIAGFLDGDLLAIANVGVCSAMLVREGKMQRLVMPRSYGHLADPFADESVPFGSFVDVPMMALGLGEDLEPEIFEYRVKPGDWLILHSDGLDRECLARIAALNAGLGIDPAAEIKQVLGEYSFRENASMAAIFF